MLFHPYHLQGARWDTFGVDPSDVAVGINWDVTSDISVNPLLTMYPSKLSFNKINAVVYLSAKIL